MQPAMNGTFTLLHGPLNAVYTAGSPQTTAPALVELLRSGEPIACDIETFGLGMDARRIKCVAFATARGAVVLNPREPADAHACRAMIRAAPELVFHNSPYDVPNLAANGLMRAEDCAKVTDTLIYARLAYPDTLERKSLDALAKRLLGLDSEESIKDAFKRLGLSIREGFKQLDIDAPMFLMGNAMDAVVTARLLPRIREHALAQTTMGHPFSEFGVRGEEATRLVEREQRVNRMLLRRAVRGLRVDMEFLESYKTTTGQERAAAEARLSAHGIRPGNANDLIRVLEAHGGIPDGYPRTPKTGRCSTTAGNLDKLSHPLARTYVTAKQIAKVQDDYLVKVSELAATTGRIHPVVNLLAATTGRMSVGEPPLQQFPGAARGIILADEGDLLTSIDWAQIEPVVAANVAGDLGVLAGYEDGSSDLYTQLSLYAGITRKVAKVVLLAQMYGEGLAKLAADLGVEMDDARDLRDRIWAAMPKVGRLLWKLRTIGQDHRKVFTLSGRILTIPMGRGFDGGPPSVATHKAVNYFVQGSAYDVLAEALIGVDETGLGDAVYLAMHDELVVSSDAAHDVNKIMSTPPERLCFLAKRTPVLRTDMAELGERWAAA